MPVYCKDCKWLKPIEVESPLNHQKVVRYICTNKNRRIHHRARNIKYDIKERCQNACKTGFEAKGDKENDK